MLGSHVTLLFWQCYATVVEALTVPGHWALWRKAGHALLNPRGWCAACLVQTSKRPESDQPDREEGGVSEPRRQPERLTVNLWSERVERDTPSSRKRNVNRSVMPWYSPEEHTAVVPATDPTVMREMANIWRHLFIFWYFKLHKHLPRLLGLKEDKNIISPLEGLCWCVGYWREIKIEDAFPFPPSVQKLSQSMTDTSTTMLPRWCNLQTRLHSCDRVV